MILKTRRNFLKGSVFGVSALIVPNATLLASTSLLDTITLVQKDLYGDLKDAPSFDKLNARAYMGLILTHTRIDEESKIFIKNGVKWLDEEARLFYKKDYIKLGKKKRDNTLKSISKDEWGNEWIYEMLSYTYEALLGDTIYGINKNESGWRWLNHKSGLPRPNEPLL